MEKKNLYFPEHLDYLKNISLIIKLYELDYTIIKKLYIIYYL